MAPLTKVLIVDDERGVRDLLSSQLSRRGYAVRCAASGEEAVAAAREERFQLAMCDLNMPRMNGLQVMDRLKSQDPDIEIILATGYATVENAVEAMRLGATEVLQKPFDLDQLNAAVDKALLRSRLLAELALYESSRALLVRLKLAELLPTVIAHLVELLAADEAYVLLKDDGGLWRVAVSRGLDPVPPPVEAPLERLLAACREPVLVAGAPRLDSRFAFLPEPARARSCLLGPLWGREELLGLLCAGRLAEPNLGSLDIRHASIFCREVALALDNARLYGALEDKVAALERARVEIQESQARLVQSEKMAVVGLLAGGLAHEIANPLTAIQGCLMRIHEGACEAPDLREALGRIGTHTTRIKGIVDDLLDYARPSAFCPEPVDLAALLEESLGLLAHEALCRKVEVVRRYGRRVPPASADPRRLKQVFLNLILNALHAMESSPRRQLTLHARTGAGQVVAEIEDTGEGVAPQNLRKLFSPFFSTKGPGRGTGLGLFVVHGIVKQHGGDIQVDSVPGRGSRFKVLLAPARAEPR